MHPPAVTAAFSTYLDRCQFDERFGYYASGAVQFGHCDHYSTFPQRLSPCFGWMLADALGYLLTPPLSDGRIPKDAPITVLEVGAGNGDLALDTLDRLLTLQHQAPWDALVPRVRYVVAERSPALRRRQEHKLAAHLATGRAAICALDARCLQWEGPFYGLVVGNEVLDAMSCEKLQVLQPASSATLGAERVHVRAASESCPCLDAQRLWDALAHPTAPIHFEEVGISLDQGWLEPDGTFSPVPPHIADHLRAAAPLVADLAALDLLPVDLYFGSSVEGLAQGLRRLLWGHQRYGVALMIDYGGTTRHLLDPRSVAPHLRVYGHASALAHQSLPYAHPGQLDITWDVDFTELGRSVARQGLVLHHFAHQSILEASTVDLWGPELRPLMIDGRVREGAQPGEEAAIEAERLVFDFREAGGFRTAIIGPPDYRVPLDRFGPGDAWSMESLLTLTPGIPPTALDAALAPLELPEPHAWLVPGCDVIANLSDAHVYALRDEVLAVLAERGWLCRPGEIASARRGSARGR